MNLFAKIFGKKPAPAPEPVVEAHHEVIARALLTLLTPQLQLLGYDLGEVPAEGGFVSKRSRGYIYGMTATIVGQLQLIGDDKVLEDSMMAAFALVYGQEMAPAAFLLTLQESGARDGETLAGAYQAEEDVTDIYAGKPYAAAMGFWLLNNGSNDPDEIMPVVLNPAPLPQV